MAHDFLQAGRKKMLAVKYIYMEYAFHPNYLIILFFLRSFFMHVNFSCFVNWKTMRIQHEKDLDFYSTLLSVATSVPQEGMKDDQQ